MASVRPQPGVQVRPASAHDAPLVERLLRSGGIRGGSSRPRPRKGQLTLIATVSGRISGVICARVCGQSAYLSDLYVLKSLRGRGIARALFAAIERHCRRRGARRLALHCEKGSRGEAWYRRMGYVCRTERKDFWGSRSGSRPITLVYMVKRIELLTRGVNRV